MTLQEIKKLPSDKLLATGYTKETIEASQKEVLKQIDELQAEYSAGNYILSVLRKGYGIGDVVKKDGVKMKVTSWDNGAFWGAPIGSKSVKQVMLYEGWVR